MKKLMAPALLAFEEDIQDRTFLDWLRAHTSFLKPLHGYSGEIILEPKRLTYQGVNAKNDEPFECVIAKDEIEQVYYGFDEFYSVFEVRSLGLLWKPLRLTVKKERKKLFIYLVINFRLGFCDNRQWFGLLQEWLS